MNPRPDTGSGIHFAPPPSTISDRGRHFRPAWRQRAAAMREGVLVFLYPRTCLNSAVAAADFSVMPAKSPETTMSFVTIQLPPTATIFGFSK